MHCVILRCIPSAWISALGRARPSVPGSRKAKENSRALRYSSCRRCLCFTFSRPGVSGMGAAAAATAAALFGVGVLRCRERWEVLFAAVLVLVRPLTAALGVRPLTASFRFPAFFRGVLRGAVVAPPAGSSSPGRSVNEVSTCSASFCFLVAERVTRGGGGGGGAILPLRLSD